MGPAALMLPLPRPAGVMPDLASFGHGQRRCIRRMDQAIPSMGELPESAAYKWGRSPVERRGFPVEAGLRLSLCFDYGIPP